jgi:hypothetical protein
MKLRDQWQPKPPFEQHVIAATAEGLLKSAFAGKPGAGIETPERAAGASRILLIASSQFLTNPFAYSGNPPPAPPQMQQFGGLPGDKDLLMIANPYANKHLRSTILALKNLLDWMSGDADLIAASAKILGEPNLTYSDVDKPKFSADDSEEAVRKKDEEYRMGRERLQNKVQWTLTLGLPLVFGLIGLWRWRARNNRVEASTFVGARRKDEDEEEEKQAA